MRIRVTPAALDDLKEIKQYISETLKNPDAADRTVRRIISDYLRLTDSPYIGTSLKAKLNIDSPYRFLVSGNYLVFYAINDDTVYINRIIYGKRDYAQILFSKSFIDFDDPTEDTP